MPVEQTYSIGQGSMGTTKGTVTTSLSNLLIISFMLHLHTKRESRGRESVDYLKKSREICIFFFLTYLQRLPSLRNKRTSFKELQTQ